MKNNVLSAFVVFFAVLACLLIIDDLTHGVKPSLQNEIIDSKTEATTSENLATLDIEAED
ncbi:hypothetical protein ACFQ1Q_06255 [Winogradskyella litorisediminis]|uniref:Uncharacterized protein n=1 Tax=Winogradskyella litorisediminis TaxID=1156618 RepID=A0ABW3N7F3_9FLAO